jgi:hypothetical protein
VADIGMCFQAPLVRAFLAGHKSQTRRTLSAARCLVDGHGVSAKRWAAMDFDWECATIDPGPSPTGNAGPYLHVFSRANSTTHRIYPRPQAGDRMWVRETFAKIAGQSVHWIDTDYRATYADGARLGDHLGIKKRWTPAIHMPREAARIERDIVGLRFERLHNISEADAMAEGVERHASGHWNDYGDQTGLQWHEAASDSFCSLWEAIHGAGSWEANPLLLVYEFAEVNRA